VYQWHTVQGVYLPLTILISASDILNKLAGKLASVATRLIPLEGSILKTVIHYLSTATFFAA
jgi:hypothetical protein